MAVQGLTIACSSTPASVVGNGQHGTIRVTLRNHGAGTAYLGDSAVTTAGYQLTSGDAPTQLLVMGGEQMFVCSSSGATPTVSVLRTCDTT